MACLTSDLSIIGDWGWEAVYFFETPGPNRFTPPPFNPTPVHLSLAFQQVNLSHLLALLVEPQGQFHSSFSVLACPPIILVPGPYLQKTVSEERYIRGKKYIRRVRSFSPYYSFFRHGFFFLN